MTTPKKPFQPTDHFLPDYHHWGDISSRLEHAIKVPIRRVQRVPWVETAPYLVYVCSWWHLNAQGALTQEKFNADLSLAIEDFSNDMNTYEEFLAYPITYDPPATDGRAYHDWIGAAYPFDVRVIIDYDTSIQIDGLEELQAGLKFHITTLISKDMVKRGE